MKPPTEAERNAVRAVDAFKGMDCGPFDPERSDRVHGRSDAPALMFDRMKGVKVFGCEACVFGERYKHTCGDESYAAGIKRLVESLPGAVSREVFGPQGDRMRFTLTGTIKAEVSC